MCSTEQSLLRVGRSTTRTFSAHYSSQPLRPNSMKISIFDADPKFTQTWKSLASVICTVQTAPTPLEIFATDEKLEMTLEEAPGLIILDDSVVPDFSVDFAENLIRQYPHQTIMVASAQSCLQHVMKLVNLGVAWVLAKPISDRLIEESLRAVWPKVLRMQEDWLSLQRYRMQFDQLSSREVEVLKLILGGVSNKESAQMLDISVRTVEARRARVYQKLQCDNLVELVRTVESYDRLRKRFASNPISLAPTTIQDVANIDQGV